MPAFITVEGGEGVGKSTQVRHLADALAAAGHAVLLTREPGGTPGAETLRELILRGEQAWSPLAEAMLHFAARADHVAHTIRPALRAGMVVVCDRFTDSTMAYQAYGGQTDPDSIRRLTEIVGLRPSLTIILTAAPEVAAARVAARRLVPDRYEGRDAAFHARVAQGFRAIAAADSARCRLVDAGGSIAAVHGAVLALVQDHLAHHLAHQA